MRSFLATLLLSATAFAQAAAPAAPVSVASLFGSWRLVSITVTMQDGSVRPDPKFGPNAKGFILYEPDGHMCAQIMNPDHMTWKNKEAPTREEKLASYDSMLSYCGAYKLDAEHMTLTHSPEVAWSPTYVGSAQPRPFRIEANHLIIMPPSPYPGTTKWVLTWERLQQ